MSEYTACMAHNKSVIKPILKQAKESGFTVKEDQDAGTIEIFDGDIMIYWAISKGTGAWIVRYLKRYFA